ncbi:MAG: hypothetical protein IT436_18390 [Phycisphaerales bacterium]|nr:hypothetical protein [Phycisphaerales bacterium]
MRSPRRRGTVFLVVLSVVALVVVLILASMAVITARRAAAEARVSAVIARAAAESALELALADAANSFAWRTSVKSGAPFAASDSFPAASFSVTAADPVDGDVTTSLDDPVTLTGAGLSGSARQMASVVLELDTTAVSGLGCALAAGGDITLSSATVRSLGTIASNASVTATSSSVLAPVIAVGSISGSTYGVSRTPLSPAVQIPAQPWADYTTIGSALSYSLAGGQLRNVVIGPGRNPYGTTNAQGVYVVNAGGGNLLIRDARILGTLVVINAGTVEVRGSVVMDPAVTGWPVLIVQGSVYFTTVGNDLSESAAGANFNPVAVPYRGDSDIDTFDNFASTLNGIVYASGNITSDAATRCTIRGALLTAGKASLAGELNLRYCINTAAAPPGFRAGGGFKIRPGSWARAVQ